MESLSTQRVGELFVMQYYTQMHGDVAQMHRFYLDNSSFVRGGPEMGSEHPVIGQKAIHDKIVSLGLSQVHTKIKQVDGHTSLSNEHGPGIVVQVTGELSVAGNSMRPFVQTFVLALQSPKKYYIHNDIFRFQLFDDDMSSDSELAEQLPPVVDCTDQQHMEPMGMKQQVEVIKSPALPEEAHYHQDHLLPAHDQGTSSSSPVPSGSVGRPEPVATQSWPDQFQQDAADGIQSNGLPEEHHEPPMEDPSYPIEPEEVEPVVLDTYPAAAAVDLEQPKTWASRLSKGIPSGGGKVVVVAPAPSPPPPVKVPNAMSHGPNQPLPQREPRQSRRSQQDRPPPTTERKPGSIFGARSLPDSFQIFVGGLPPTTTDQDLRNVFDGYGNILEIRTNPKNFGFIVFDNEDSVQQIMQQKVIEPFQIGRKTLNIEEKKPSEKRSSGAGGVGGGADRPSGGGRRQVPTAASGPGSGSGSNRGKGTASAGGKPPPRGRNN